MAVTHKIIGLHLEGVPSDFVSENVPKPGDYVTEEALGRAERALTKRVPGAKMFVATDGPDAWRALWMRRGERFSWIAINEDWNETMLNPSVRIDDERAAEELPESLRGRAGEAVIDLEWDSFAQLTEAMGALAAVLTPPSIVTAVVDAEGHRYRVTVDATKGFEVSPMKWTVKGAGMTELAKRLFHFDAPLPDFPFGVYQSVTRAAPSTGPTAPAHDPAKAFTTGTVKRRITSLETALYSSITVEAALPIITSTLADEANQGEAWAPVREALYRRLARLPSNATIVDMFCDAIVREPATFDEVFVKIAPTAALQALSQRGVKALPAPVAKRVTAILKKRKIG